MSNAGNDCASLCKVIDTETKKTQQIAAGLSAIKEQLEADRVAFCITFRKSFSIYAKEPTVHRKKFKQTLDDFDSKLA